MPSQNELARPPILRVGSLTPKRLPLEIGRPVTGSQPDPETNELPLELVTLNGYLWSDTRCPATVKDEVSKARERWFELRFADDAPRNEDGTPVETPQQDAAYHDYLRDVLLALIPGLEWQEANAWVGDALMTRTALEYLGFWLPDVEVAAARRDTPDPPAEAVSKAEATSDGSTPTSSRRTTARASKTGSRSRKR